MMEKKKVPKLEQIKNWGWAKKDKMLLRVLGVRGGIDFWGCLKL